MDRSRARRVASFRIIALAAALAACAARTEPLDPLRYRLADIGSETEGDWNPRRDDSRLRDLAARYPEFFESVWGPRSDGEPNLLPLRDDLERSPVGRRNYDALNAVAAGYFRTLFLQEAARTDESADLDFLKLGFRSAKLVAVPWRAYQEIADSNLRDAILDFFEDAGSGHKTGSRAAIGRLPRIIDSLAAKEPDGTRRRRIGALRDDIHARAFQGQSEAAHGR